MDGISMTSKANILVLFANTYDMLDETKNKVTGCSVHYLFWGEQGEQLLGQSELDVSKPVGIQRAKCSLDITKRAKIPVAPAVYEGTFEMTVGSDGKPVLKLVDVAYRSHVDIKGKVLPGFYAPGMIAADEPKDTKASK